MTLSPECIDELLGDRWVLEFDKESELDVLCQLDELVPNDGVFWDVGAHAGLYSIVCSQLFPDASIFAFEPSEFTRESILSENVDDFPNVTIVPHPLADQTGTVTYQDSGQGHTTNALKSAANEPENPTEVELQAYTATDVVDELGVTPPDVVKLDVEGAESRVLRGFDETLFSQLSMIICELHHLDGEDTETVPYLRDRGFEITYLDERETYDDRRQEHVIATPTA